MSMAGIEAISDKVLEILCPEEAGNSFAIDFQALVDTGLQKYGIYVYPASEVELGDRLAATGPSGDGPINILLAGDLWDSLFEDGKRGNRARATVRGQPSPTSLGTRCFMCPSSAAGSSPPSVS